MIRLTEVHLDETAEHLVLEVLRSGRLAQGPKVEQFEQAFAVVAGTTHAVAVSSGTAALAAALQALDLEPGDEVITTPFTFVATLNAALAAGATVQLVDILPSDCTIDPEAVASVLGPRTRVVMPVHLYGYPADLERIEQVLDGRGVTIVEDAAEAHGAEVAGRQAGSFGLGVFSFYATKNITTGEGGVVTTNSDDLADRLRLLRNQGMRGRYEYVMRGNNYRMTEMQAAIGLSQLPHLEEWTDRRRRNADRLSEGLAGIEGLELPGEEPGRRHVYHQFTVRLRRDAGLDRDNVAAVCREHEIETGIYYPRPCHNYGCFRDDPAVLATPMPHAEAAAREVLSLPVHQWLEDADVDRVVEVVAEAVRLGHAPAGTPRT